MSFLYRLPQTEVLLQCLKSFRRMRAVLLTCLLVFILCLGCSPAAQDAGQTPVVVISDLYSPGQDVGDNFDILTPYALDNIDLKAVVFDVTDDFRMVSRENPILREPGFTVVQQLNYLFDVDVPCGCGPFTALRSETDTKEDVPHYQTRGIDLLFDVLENSDRPVHIVSTGSCRPLAVAYNRNPELMCSDKVAAVHIAAGSTSDEFMEWNIALDSLAASRVFKSDMNIILYPCATEDGPFARNENNAFWALRDLDFVLEMEPVLRNYIIYQLLSLDRPDFLSYLEIPLPDEHAEALKDRSVDEWYGSGGRHYVWETAVWQQVADLHLVSHPDGNASLLPSDCIASDDAVFEEGLRYVELSVKDNGLFTYRYTDKPTRARIYYRKDPWENEILLNLALPNLYKNFKSKIENNH